jgi:hypothetical protein
MLRPTAISRITPTRDSSLARSGRIHTGTSGRLSLRKWRTLRLPRNDHSAHGCRSKTHCVLVRSTSSLMPTHTRCVSSPALGGVGPVEQAGLGPSEHDQHPGRSQPAPGRSRSMSTMASPERARSSMSRAHTPHRPWRLHVDFPARLLVQDQHPQGSVLSHLASNSSSAGLPPESRPTAWFSRRCGSVAGRKSPRRTLSLGAAVDQAEPGGVAGRGRAAYVGRDSIGGGTGPRGAGPRTGKAMHVVERLARRGISTGRRRALDGPVLRRAPRRPGPAPPRCRPAPTSPRRGPAHSRRARRTRCRSTRTVRHARSQGTQTPRRTVCGRGGLVKFRHLPGPPWLRPAHPGSVLAGVGG